MREVTSEFLFQSLCVYVCLLLRTGLILFRLSEHTSLSEKDLSQNAMTFLWRSWRCMCLYSDVYVYVYVILLHGVGSCRTLDVCLMALRCVMCSVSVVRSSLWTFLRIWHRHRSAYVERGVATYIRIYEIACDTHTHVHTHTHTHTA